jgi:hypothetical protein
MWLKSSDLVRVPRLTVHGSLPSLPPYTFVAWCLATGTKNARADIFCVVWTCAGTRQRLVCFTYKPIRGRSWGISFPTQVRFSSSSHYVNLTSKWFFCKCGCTSVSQDKPRLDKILSEKKRHDWSTVPVGHGQDIGGCYCSVWCPEWLCSGIISKGLFENIALSVCFGQGPQGILECLIIAREKGKCYSSKTVLGLEAGISSSVKMTD